jgi:hypothetical protein
MLRFIWLPLKFQNPRITSSGKKERAGERKSEKRGGHHIFLPTTHHGSKFTQIKNSDSEFATLPCPASLPGPMFWYFP